MRLLLTLVILASVALMLLGAVAAILVFPSWLTFAYGSAFALAIGPALDALAAIWTVKPTHHTRTNP